MGTPGREGSGGTGMRTKYSNTFMESMSSCANLKHNSYSILRLDYKMVFRCSTLVNDFYDIFFPYFILNRNVSKI